MKHLLVSFLLFCSIGAFGQRTLIFQNDTLNKTYTVNVGNTISIAYTGYLGQEEKFKSMVTEITDSTITLGYDDEMFGASLFKDPSFSYSKTVRIADIHKFRFISNGRLLAKSFLTLGTIVGSYYVLVKYISPNLSPAQGFIASIGIGIGSKLLIDRIFPEGPKYLVANNWKVAVVRL